VTVLPATADDLDAIAALTAAHRRRLAAAAPRWWRPAAGADEMHRLWLGHLVGADGPVVRVVEEGGEVVGCGIAVPQAAQWFLDDLAVRSDADWAGPGAALLAAVTERPVLTCTAVGDGAREDALRGAGWAPASRCWVGEAAGDPPAAVAPLGPGAPLPAPPPHTFGPIDPTAGGFALGDDRGGAVVGSAPVTAPPVYDPGGTVCLVDRLAGPDPGLLVRAAAAAAAGRGAARLAVVAGAADHRLADALAAAGFAPTVEIYLR
jgi:hypothetical protein